mmetsp:Transcript_18352/g.45046  ORF Transcript_18352/g.45046 Transcript_18352/m.45046 type:complete len:178 (-) Transcript_18352:148-681(-)
MKLFLLVPVLVASITFLEPTFRKEDACPQFLFAPGIHLQTIKVDPQSGLWSIFFRAQPGSEVGYHRHIGTVSGLTLSGKWYYEEHKEEWVATKGAYVEEPAGSGHTLIIPADGEEETEIFFQIDGALEFRNATTMEVLGTFDWTNLVELQQKQCSEENALCSCLDNVVALDSGACKI